MIMGLRGIRYIINYRAPLWWNDHVSWLPWWLKFCECVSFHGRTGTHANRCPRNHDCR